MEKSYLYVLVYDCNGKEVMMCSTINYAVAQRKKAWYDAQLGKVGIIKKMYKRT